MDVEHLISEILVRPSLWDRKENNHHNRFVLDRLWSEVAVALKTTPAVARSKWKNLRDKFRTILVSISKSKSGEFNLTDYKGEWKYFKSLLFLKDQFGPRKSSSNPVENKDSSLNMFHDLIDIDYEVKTEFSTEEEHTSESAQDTLASNRPSTSTGKQSDERNSNKRYLSDVLLLQEEKEESQYLHEKRAKQEEDDEDLSFFKSLLPHVRAFSAYDKMSYRMEVIKITQEYLKTKLRTTADLG